MLKLTSALVLIAGCGTLGDTAGDSPVAVHAMGNAQKGPLATGSSVQVFPLDANLVPVGTVYSSQIADDLGSFELSFTISEPFVEIVVNGFYFDELTTNLSGAPVTLRAYARWQQASSLRVNLLTTMAESRIKFLVQQGASFDVAATQAKNELFAVFANDGTSFDDLVTMDITGAGANSAALIATSAVLLEHAASNSTSPGERVAALSLVAAQIASDLKDDGLASPSLARSLARAAHFLDVHVVETNLRSIYDRLGRAITVPALAPDVDPLANRYPWAAPVMTPTGGDDEAACAVGTKIYLAGSCDQTACGTHQLLEYDTVAGTVTARAAMPTARAYATCGVVGGKVYVLGGLSNGNDVSTAISNVDVYDPGTDTWAQKAPSPQPQFRRQVAVVNNQIYLVGSSGNLNVPSTALLDKYDPVMNSWTSLPAMSTPRATPAVCAFGGKIYVFGGFDRVSPPTILTLQSIEVFDTSANTWSARMPMSSPRAWAGCSEIGGQLYIVGGENLGVALFANNDRYDPSSDTWTALTPVGSSKRGARCYGRERQHLRVRLAPDRCLRPSQGMKAVSGWRIRGRRSVITRRMRADEGIDEAAAGWARDNDSIVESSKMKAG
ncbi:MAG: hypothetical protein JWO36_5514 [Myxococcales bacterium]|nr:hypothetical protein [Myxococcales bacterium]